MLLRLAATELRPIYQQRRYVMQTETTNKRHHHRRHLFAHSISVNE